MLQGTDPLSGCPIVISARNKKERSFLALQRKKKEAEGLNHKAKRLLKVPEKARNFKHIQQLLRKVEKLTSQIIGIPLFQ